MSRLFLLSTIGAAVGATAASAQEAATLPELLRSTHVHGLALDPEAEDRVLIATHHGLFTFDLATEELAPLGESRQDFMGFSVDPSGRFFGSGHPETGGNSGVIASNDGGESWSLLSDGVNGPVDFHQLAVSPAPDGLIDLAASGLYPETLYAATEARLLKSEDRGQTWAPAHPAPLPVSFVETGPDHTLYAFVLGQGLMRAEEESLDWTLVSEPLGGEYILHFATDGTRALAATGSGALLVSEDGGASWAPLG